ncbi:MAG TPA: IPT/TIG domain-containing protein [Puia sp.]|nr:IPT/TIG domain-containing protein [Puia sp.]
MKTFYTITFFAILIWGLIPACKKSSANATLTFSPGADTLGGMVTLSGINFGATPNSDLVYFVGANPAQIVSASATQLSVVVPQYAVDGKITVDINGTLYKSGADFIVSPTCVPIAQGVGYMVIIYARGFFSSTLAANVVKFNGTPAMVTAANADQLTVTVPTGATSGPVSVTVNGQTLSTLDNFTVLPVGQVSTLAGSGSAGAVNAQGSAASFNQPEGLATDANGNIYVADYGNNLIRLVTPAGVVSTFAGSGAAYSPATDGPKLEAALYGPSSLVLARDSNTVYSTDYGGNRVREIKNGYLSTLSNNGGIPYTIYFFPSGISLDAIGNLYFTNLDGTIGEITTDSIGQTYAGMNITLNEGGMQVPYNMYNPVATAFDQAGNLYVSDQGDGKILKFGAPGQATLFAGGNEYSDSSDGPGLQAGFQHPAGIAFDGQGNLYVADEGNNEIRRIDVYGNVSTVAGNRAVGAGSADGNGAGATFDQPYGIVVDKNGVIYVSEAGGNKIRKIVF